MPLLACQDFVHHPVDLSSLSGISNMVEMIEGAIDCSSLALLWGSNNLVLAGMIFGGLSFGMVKRVLLFRKERGLKSKVDRKSKKYKQKHLNN